MRRFGAVRRTPRVQNRWNTVLSTETCGQGLLVRTACTSQMKNLYL